MPEIILIAAMRRELWPLVKRWKRLANDDPREMYVQGDYLAIFGGIGPVAAREAAETAIAMCGPKLVISAGLAGASDPAWKVGAAMIPATVVDMSTGERFETGCGEGVLASSPKVLDVAGKRNARQLFAADAVDMEAVAVARVAQSHDLGFMAVKAISDDVHFSMPDVGLSIDAKGNFHAGRFLAAHVLRPASWAAVVRLAVNSGRASRKLCRVLAHHIQQQSFQQPGALEMLSPRRN